MSAWGLWPTTRHLLAVAVDEAGKLSVPLRISPTDQARWSFLTWLQAQQHREIVLPETMAADPIIALAAKTDISVRLAPQELLHAIRIIAGLPRRPPKYTAALLARWPTTPLRACLRPVPSPNPPPNQLGLL